jgi:hypothetical protein
MKLSQILVAMSCALVLCGVPSGTQSRDQIVVVGSSVIYPFSVVVADHYRQSLSELARHRINIARPADSALGTRARSWRSRCPRVARHGTKLYLLGGRRKIAG